MENQTRKKFKPTVTVDSKKMAREIRNKILISYAKLIMDLKIPKIQLYVLDIDGAICSALESVLLEVKKMNNVNRNDYKVDPTRQLKVVGIGGMEYTCKLNEIAKKINDVFNFKLENLAEQIGMMMSYGTIMCGFNTWFNELRIGNTKIRGSKKLVNGKMEQEMKDIKELGWNASFAPLLKGSTISPELASSQLQALCVGNQIMGLMKNSNTDYSEKYAKALYF